MCIGRFRVSVEYVVVESEIGIVIRCDGVDVELRVLDWDVRCGGFVDNFVFVVEVRDIGWGFVDVEVDNGCEFFFVLVGEGIVDNIVCWFI